MNFDQIKRKILEDASVKIAEMFDRNFETKSFFGDAWKPAKLHNNKGSLMIRSGHLRQSIEKPVIFGDSVLWTSTLPYAKIQNEGGTITVTPKMKKFFWVMYYKSSGKIKQRKKGDGITKATEKHSAAAEHWKALALMKAGSKLTIPKRQFIGAHPQITDAVQKIAAKHGEKIEQEILKYLNFKHL